jgi:hypothetical protein
MIFLNPSRTKSVEHSLSRSAKFFFVLILSLCSAALGETTPHLVKGKVKILPLVSFYSLLADGEVYNWWAENDSLGDMKSFSDHFHKSLEMAELSKWSYLSTTALQKDSNPLFHVGSLSREQKREFAKVKGAGLILAGDLRFQPSPLYEKGVRISQKLELVRLKNGEVIGESLRIFDLPRHEYEKIIRMGPVANREFFAGATLDLHEKIENYKIKNDSKPETHLVVMGSLSYDQLEKIKDKIQRQTPGVQQLMTKSLERDQVVLQVQGISGEKLSQALSHVLWKGYRTQVVSTDAKQVVFDVKVKNGIN